ncbi:MAG: diguanylate cyclase domain-containing protein [Rhodocyclaceae bacterium]
MKSSFLRALTASQRWQVIGLIAALVALSWLDFEASRIDSAARERYLEDLYVAEELLARLDREVLASQQGLVQHFDGLRQLAATARETTDRLKSPPRHLSGDDRRSLLAMSEAISANLSAKLDGIDRFTRQLSRLRNSLAWFPTAVDEMTMGPSHLEDARSVRALAHYASHVMRYLRAPRAMGRDEVKAARDELLAQRISAIEGERIANLIRHGDLLVAEWPELLEGIDALLDDRLRVQLGKLRETFEAAHSRSELTAGRYRHAMYWLALLLAAWLAGLFLSLLRANRALERAHAETQAHYRQLLATQERLKLHATVFENAQEGIMLTAPDKTMIDINPAFTHTTGYSREEAIGQTPRLLQSGRHDSAFYRTMWDSIETTGHWQGEIWNRNKAGEIYPEWLSITAVKDEAGRTSHYIGIFTDISRQKAQERLLTHLAYYDALTNLPNRTLLLDRAHQAMALARRTGRTLAVCLLDLDGFKPINDTFGHAAGDRVLNELARRMQGLLREADTVARLGGDEFVLLLPDLDDPETCFEVVERLQQSIGQPFDFLPSAVTVSASIGITFYPADDADADTLLRHADQAMYVAKQTGKRRHQVFDVRHDRAQRELHEQRAPCPGARGR